MTTVNSLSQSNDPLVRGLFLSCALQLSEATIKTYIREKKIPRPDAHSNVGQAKLWRLSTIRAWRPDVADTVELLLKIPTNRAA
jgi:hypothetical protein